MTSQLGTHYKGTILLLLLTARQVKLMGKLNLKIEEERWLTVLCWSRPNKVSCKNYSNTPGISMHIFPKKAKWKQEWTTFARIHRLAFQRNTLPCAATILKHRVSTEMCLLGHQWISKRFYLEKGSVPSIYAKPKDSLVIDCLRNLQIDFSRETFFGRFFGTPSFPTEKRQYPNSPPPKKKKTITFRIG